MTKVRALGTQRIIGFGIIALTVALTLFFFTGRGQASHGTACNDLPSQDRLEVALTAARGEANGGLNLDMWATVVNRDGVVCAVAFTGEDRGDQ